MEILSLLLALAATYLPPVTAARGRGSRGMWIALIPVGSFVAVASIMLGRYLLGTFDPVLYHRPEGMSSQRRMTFDLISLIARAAVAFCFGSFLAALLYRKREAASPGQLGLSK